MTTMADSHPMPAGTPREANPNSSERSSEIDDPIVESSMRDSISDEEASSKKIHPNPEGLKSDGEPPPPGLVAASATSSAAASSATSARRPSCQNSSTDGTTVSTTPWESASHWDGEIALSVLQAQPRDGATGRRKSTVRRSSAAAAVGAFASKRDREEDDVVAKKKLNEHWRRHSLQPRDTSTFDERLMKKLRESRSNSAGDACNAGRRRSSTFSFASSRGSSCNFESIEEGSQMNFKGCDEEGAPDGQIAHEQTVDIDHAGSDGDLNHSNSVGNAGAAGRRRSSVLSFASSHGSNSIFESIEEGSQMNFEGHGEGAAPTPSFQGCKLEETSAVGRIAHEEKADIDHAGSAGDLKSPHGNYSGLKSRLNCISPNSLSRTSFSGGGSSKGTDDPPRRPSHSSLTNEEYEEFVRRKVSSRGGVLTQEERRDSFADGEGASAPPPAPPRLEWPPSPTEGEIVLTAEVHASPGLGIGASAEETVPSAEVHATQGNEFTSAGFTQCAPRVRDAEEEKVELFSEEDAVVKSDEGQQSILTAVCATTTSAVNEGKKPQRSTYPSDEGQQSNLTAACATTTSAVGDEGQQSLNDTDDAPRRPSHISLTNEEYEEFVRWKISSRGGVVKHSECKRRASFADEEGAPAPPPAPPRLEQPPSPTEGETVLTTEVHASPGPGIGTSAEETVLSAEVHATQGNERMSAGFTQCAPRVRDEEEEKVELSSEEDAVVKSDEGQQSNLTAVCSTTTSAVDEGKKSRRSTCPSDEGQQSNLTAACATTTPAVGDGKKPRRATCPEVSSVDNNSPFSSMIAERQKVVTHDMLLDPEDLVDNADQAPGTLDPMTTTDRRRNRRISPEFLTGSMIAAVDRLRRGATRSLSLESNAATQASVEEARRRDTYALGSNAEERSCALRELAHMVEAQDVVQARLVPEERPIQTVEAIPMDDFDEAAERSREGRQRLKKQIVLVWTPLVLLVIMIAVGIATIEGRKGDEGDKGGGDEGGEPPPAEEETVYDPTLVQVKKEGVLRCGVPDKYGFATPNNVTGEKEGISVDFCKAVAAAVLGPEYRVELIEVTSITRFTSLKGREIDLLIWGDTHTMERDFREGRTLVGFQFTDPYFYDGLGFAGQPSAVNCADDFYWLGACSDLKICVNAGTTHVDILRQKFPDPNIILRDTKDEFLREFVDGGCNVIAGEQNDISEISVRLQGYTGDFENGQKVLSKEPLAMVTRKNDQSWTDIVNWVLRALIHAEIINVSQENANEFTGDEYDHDHWCDSEIDFVSALEAVGNYGDIYERNMEEVVPRKGLNLLYTSSEVDKSGLHYSHPTGTIDEFRHEFAPEGKISKILQHGKLICGIIGDENQSMESDYCHALSASLFASDSSLVEFVVLSSEDNLMENLDRGDVDVIVGATVALRNDVMPSNTTASGLSGMAFTQPYFYDRTHHFDAFNRGPVGTKAMATSQNDADWSTFVYWVAANLIWAEEKGITSDDFRNVPEVKLFGKKFEWMFRGISIAVGNYGEIYRRNIKHLPPRANQNLLNDGSSPQLWHPQF